MVQRMNKEPEKPIEIKKILDLLEWNDLLYFWKKTNPDFEIQFKDDLTEELFKGNFKFFKHVMINSQSLHKDKRIDLTVIVRKTFSLGYIEEGLKNYLLKKAEKIISEKRRKELLAKKAEIDDKTSTTSKASTSTSTTGTIKSFFTSFVSREKKPETSIKSSVSSVSSEVTEPEMDELKDSIQTERLLRTAIQEFWKVADFLYGTKKPSGIFFLEIPSSLRKEYFEQQLGVTPGLKEMVEIYALDNSVYGQQHLKCNLQIENDIPRSNQYHYLFNSFLGRKHIYKLLTSWLNIDKNYSYSQGLDGIAAVISEISGFDFESSVVLFDKFLNKFLPSIKDPTENLLYVRSHIGRIELILSFFEPALALHIQRIGFASNMFAISWILTFYSNIFTIDRVIKIWEKMLVIPDFHYYFAAAMLCDLKSKIMLMDFNECAACIKNLEGLVDIDHCIQYAVVMAKSLPKSFLVLNYRKEGDDEQFQNEFYTTRPWEIPPRLTDLTTQKNFSISIFEMVSLKHKPLIIDVRSEKEYEERSLVTSFHFKLEKDILNEAYIEFLQLKTQNFLSYDILVDEKLDERAILERISKSFLIVIVDNYQGKNADVVLDILLENEIRNVCILRGGIQAVTLDAPELLQEKVKPTNITMIKKEIKSMQLKNAPQEGKGEK